MAKITEDYVSFETAKLLIEKGFNEYCPLWYNLDKPLEGPFFYKEIGWYGHNSYDYNGKRIVSAPTLHMVMKWLEIKKHIAIIPVLSSILDNEKFLWDVKIVIAETSEKYSQGWVYENREQACEAAVKYILENLI